MTYHKTATARQGKQTRRLITERSIPRPLIALAPQRGKMPGLSSHWGRESQLTQGQEPEAYYLLLPLRVNSVTETSEADPGPGSVYTSLPLCLAE